jgi:hypothetical protein
VITWAEMIEITTATELSSVASASQTAILTMVEAQVDTESWGDLYDFGCAYLAAHLATIGRRKGVGGSVSGESVGSVSRQYANSVAAGAAQLGSTSYGVEYERLIGLLPNVRFEVP